MKILRFLLLKILSLTLLTVSAQPKLIYITNQTISEVCFERGRFVNFVGKEIKILEDFQRNLEKPKHLMLYSVIRKDTIPDFQLAAYPELTSAERKLLIDQLIKIKPIKSYVIDFHYVLEYLDKRLKETDNITFIPELINPVTFTEICFQRAPLEEKIRLLREKSVHEVLPVLSAFARNSHHRYQNVISVGYRINKALNTNSFNLDSLTTYNPRYWKAMIEMMPDNYLIYTMKIFLLIADNQLDMAFRLASVLDLFKKNNSIADYYLDELIWLNIIFKQQELILEKIQKKIDNQENEQAQQLLDTLLKAFPSSAEAWKMQYYLDRLNGVDNPTIQSRILKADPFLCPAEDSSFLAENKSSQLKKETENLFKEKVYFHRDFMRYANIALLLGQYDFAAHLYWLSVTHFSEKEAGSTRPEVFFLYCLEKLGLHELIIELDKRATEKIQQLNISELF